MAFGNGGVGCYSNILLAVLIIAAAVAPLLPMPAASASGLNLKARDHRCKKAEEGRRVTVLIQGVPYDCRCEGGIVNGCERRCDADCKRRCNEELKVRRTSVLLRYFYSSFRTLRHEMLTIAR